jgi:hypothetical protein
MRILRLTTCPGILVMLFACSEEPPPVSVAEFMEQPRLLEATMVRCAQNRSESRYLVDCINARDAVNRIEAAQERTRRQDLESQSERKRQALRRTQQAAAEARRRTKEAQRLQEEQEYLGLFDSATVGSTVTEGSDSFPTGGAENNMPGLVVEEPQSQDDEQTIPEEKPTEPETDLGAIREELKRRQEINN